MSVIPRKWCLHQVLRDSKSPRRTKNTTRSKFTTRSIFSTAGSFGWESGDSESRDSNRAIPRLRLNIDMYGSLPVAILNRFSAILLYCDSTHPAAKGGEAQGDRQKKKVTKKRQKKLQNGCQNQGPLNGGVSNRGGFPIWTCPSFFVLFLSFLGLSRFYLGFSRFVLFLCGDFPDVSFSSFLAY